MRPADETALECPQESLQSHPLIAEVLRILTDSTLETILTLAIALYFKMGC